VATYLDDIVAAHRRRADSDDRTVASMRAALRAMPPTRDFAAALRLPGLSVIAEIKRRSPSKGDLAVDLDPAVVASEYQAGGAAALSVLTDEDHFGGSVGDLHAARHATKLPVLRKDFTVDERDVLDARLMGADACLLIVAALDDVELSSFLALSSEVGLAALVEVHDDQELERALHAGATIVGVNQRDLRTFQVDPERCRSMAASIPSSVLAVAESGVRGHDDAVELAAAGYDAILVGESVVTSTSRTEAVGALRGHDVTLRPTRGAQ
jgi:indole-3-glycerol phosphate synthase